ncbi:MAG: glutamate--tRNA ligase [Bacteroidota bacterium]|jgi:glutamyl-tRNA synthetase|nr:glutamate--tRNA ligase [Bacteroidota bacterium]
MSTITPRVRFAPSPTGYLHVGGLRTALYNYLFARRHGGTVILRIEDTDRGRYVEGAAEALAETLAWAGLHFDEGPALGGAHGPYVQSERSEIYAAHVARLLAEDKAYRCFCTPEELEASRQRQIAEKRDPAYDGRCRRLDAEDIQRRMADGLPFTVRLKVPRMGQLQLRDLIRGDIVVQYDTIDDQVLLKSDGFPTYHLANVVDDHLMEITHVIRGEEWLPSTPKHVLLYEFFGWDAPEFAHLPLLLNADRSKLSKRQGDVAVEDYRAKGFLPEALVNFVALLGWNPGDDRELFSRDELAQSFSLDRVSKAGAVFDVEKLKWFNAQYLRALPPARLADLCAPWLRAAGIDTDDTARAMQVTTAFANYLEVPADIAPHLGFLSPAPIVLASDAERAAIAAPEARRVLTAFATRAADIEPWNRETIKAMIKSVQTETGVKGKALFLPLRLALSGAEHGPDLGIIAELLGRARTLERIRAMRG